MINMKTVDLTTSGQKTIAAIFLAIFVGFIWYLLPSLIWFFEHVIYLLILVAIVTIMLFNANNIWKTFKMLTWEATKLRISSNKLWHLYQYHTYMLGKIEELSKSVQSISALRSQTQRRSKELISELEILKKNAVEAQTKMPNLVKVYSGKVKVLQEQIDNLLPKIDFLNAQEAGLIRLHTNWKDDTELLKYTLDSKAEEYRLMKELSSAADSSKAFLKGDSEAEREYNESLRQIEKDVNLFTANVENFNRQIEPKLQQMDLKREVSEQEGMKIIEEYKQNRLKL